MTGLKEETEPMRSELLLKVLLLSVSACPRARPLARRWLPSHCLLSRAVPCIDRRPAQVDLEPHEPYSPPSNMYLWWGPSTNHRFVGSGEHIRHLLHMGQVCVCVCV